jgi:hypothetical protein
MKVDAVRLLGVLLTAVAMAAGFAHHEQSGAVGLAAVHGEGAENCIDATRFPAIYLRN